MDTMKQIVLQEMIEKRYNRKHIDGYIREAIASNPDMQERIKRGVELVEAFMQGKYYQSKMVRVKQLVGLDIEALVMDIFVGIAYCLKEELFTSVTAQLASRLRFDDKEAAITTVAELVAVLCATDAFDINKASKGSSLVVVSCIPLGDELIGFIRNSEYLPPMVCVPLELENNFSSGYLTHNDSLILGKGNHHDGDICLDVLNTVNKVALKLDTDFLCAVEEEPTFELNTQLKIDQWTDFKEQSKQFYLLMVECGNEFYLTNRVDKRGRIYCSGFHITIQGTAFKKASIELSKQELVTGVP